MYPSLIVIISEASKKKKSQFIEMGSKLRGIKPSVLCTSTNYLFCICLWKRLLKTSVLTDIIKKVPKNNLDIIGIKE